MLYAGVLGSEECHPTVVTILLSLESAFAVIAVILAQIPNPFEKKVKA